VRKDLSPAARLAFQQTASLVRQVPRCCNL
jgi:hypothetical protein